MLRRFFPRFFQNAEPPAAEPPAAEPPAAEPPDAAANEFNIEEIFNIIPYEDIRYSGTGLIGYDPIYIPHIRAILPTIALPITILQGIEIQQRLRTLAGKETNLIPAEIADADYVSPVARQDGALCNSCFNDESDARRLYKVHYSHQDDDEGRMCKSCLIKHFKSQHGPTENLRNNAIGCSCFDVRCTRKLTEYQMVKLVSSGPELIVDNVNPPMLVTEYFESFLNLKREQFFIMVAELTTRANMTNRVVRQRLARIANENRARAALRPAEAARRLQLDKYYGYIRNAREARETGLKTALDTCSIISPIAPLARETIMCPWCLDPMERIDGCMYMSHQVRRGGAIYTISCPNGITEFMRGMYPLPAGYNPWTCLCCGRPCIGHKHLRKDGNELINVPEAHYHDDGDVDALERQCINQGGLGRVEFIVRMIALRDGIIEAYTAGNYILTEDIRNDLTYRIFTYINADPNPLDPRNPWTRATNSILLGRFDNDLPRIPERPRHRLGNEGYNPNLNEEQQRTIFDYYSVLGKVKNFLEEHGHAVVGVGILAASVLTNPEAASGLVGAVMQRPGQAAAAGGVMAAILAQHAGLIGGSRKPKTRKYKSRRTRRFTYKK
jgi:hypothetical protein